MDDVTGMGLKTISFVEISGSCQNYKPVQVRRGEGTLLL